jgi:hypothetical protein
MPLKDTIESIVRNLNEGRYPNEQAISQGVVIRVLSELNWDQWNPDHVWPEYAVGSRRVDFALCFPSRKPMIFVEVKQPGRGDGADQQLFEYAFHEGVPMALLCDGRTWSFYLPGEQGSYEERRIYKLDLVERPAAEAAEKLQMYLAYSRVVSGEAIEQARRDYRDQNRRQTSKRTLPEAWKSLIEDEDPSIVERLATEVEAKCGIRPEFDDVTVFLSRLRIDGGFSLSPTKQSPTPASSIAKVVVSDLATGPIGYSLRGNWFACHSAKEVMIGLLQRLSQEQAGFCDSCYRQEDNRGRSRIYISKNRYELYQKTPEFSENHSEQFVPGWFVATNLSNQAKENIIRMAIRVAGLTLNVDFTFRLA